MYSHTLNEVGVAVCPLILNEVHVRSCMSSHT